VSVSSINPYARAGGGQPQGLADILERVLDKGVVIAGDIQVNLLDIELLTIKVRLLIASADTAQQMGIDWWRNDPFLSAESAERSRGSNDETKALKERVEELEAALSRLSELPSQAAEPSETAEPDKEPESGDR
jgi:hypothetical protein